MTLRRWQATLLAIAIWPIGSINLSTFGLWINLFTIIEIGLQWVHSNYGTPYLHLSWPTYKLLIQWGGHVELKVSDGGQPPVYTTTYRRGKLHRRGREL